MRASCLRNRRPSTLPPNMQGRQHLSKREIESIEWVATTGRLYYTCQNGRRVGKTEKQSERVPTGRIL